MRDLYSNLAPVHLLDAKSISTDTPTSIVDTSGFDSLVVSVNIGVITTPDSNSYLTPVLQHSDTIVGTDFTAVGAGDMDGAFYAINAASKDQVSVRVGYGGMKRYVRVLFDITDGDGGISSALVSADAWLGHAHYHPVVSPAPITAT